MNRSAAMPSADHPRLLRLLCWLALLACALPLHAQERILSYDSVVRIASDGSQDVTETIRVRAEGDNIRRGIYRDFPTRYRNAHGNRVVVDFTMLDVQRDGRTEPWFTETRPNGVRINTGNDDLLPTPAEFTYTLRYRTSRQLGFFARNDELYWNAIGTGWDFPIERGSVEVVLPAPVPVAELHAEGYVGVQGAADQDYTATLPAPGTARWELTRPLQPREGFSVVLTFPKGLVAEPSRAQKLHWLLRDNRGALLAFAGLLGLLAYCIATWRRIGRDPSAGTIIARYDPPAGYSPAGLRFMQRMGYDTRCFSSELLSLAVAGGLTIHRDKQLLKDHWDLKKGAGGATGLVSEQQVLQQALFQGRDELELDSGNAAELLSILHKHTKALEARFKPAMFSTNGGKALIALAIAMLATIAALLFSGGTGILLILPSALLMLVTVIVFAFVVRAPTPQGRRLLDEIEGFKRYLSVADQPDLQRLKGPDAPEPSLDAGRFEALLPYAVALEVEDAWTKKFTLAVGAAAAAAATTAIGWYSGSHLGNDLGGFTKALGSSLASQISSSASPPGSASGSGGGGFSGGGGGGGGGGGR